MTEKEIRESRNDIPEISEGLNERIINQYDAKIPARKAFKFKPWHGLSIAGGCLATAMIVSIVVLNPKLNETPTYKVDPITPYVSETTSESTIYEKSSGTSTSETLGYSKGGSTCAEETIGEIPGGEGLSRGESDEYIGDNSNKIVAGRLTACALNDNNNFDYFQELVTKGQETKGLFYEYYDTFAFKTKNRVKVITPENVNAQVELIDDNQQTVFTSVADKSGVSYLYSKDYYENYTIKVTYLTSDGFDVIKADAQEVVDLTNEITDGISKYENIIELMVIIDTTGSMGDEISYLKAELANVIDRVTANTNATVKLSILAYKDVDDANTNDGYLTRFTDFSTDIQTQQSFLESLYATGGGDFEEAVEVALNEGLAASWSEYSTKIALFVADAPAHDNKVDEWNKLASLYANSGIRVITLASSGIDKKTEYFFRCQSMMTNGYYTYLTNHSGIGGDHLEATIEEPLEIELVNSMLVRLINGYYTGTFAAPVNYLQDTQ